MENLNDLYYSFLAWLCLAVPGGVVAFALGLRNFRPAAFQELLPPQRRRAVPWTGMEIALAFFLAFLCIPPLVYFFFSEIKFFDWIYGTGTTQSLETLAQTLNGEETGAKKIMTARLALWVGILSFPVAAVLIPFCLRRLSGTHLYQLGLSGHRSTQNVILGYLVWLFLSPLIYGLNFFVELGYSLFRTAPPVSHPMTYLLQNEPLAVDWVAILFLTLAAAPVVEEMLFRGVLQSWLTKRRWGGDAAMVLAFAYSLFSQIGTIQKALQAGLTAEGFWIALDGLSPTLFVLAMLPGYVMIEMLTWRWLPEPYVARAIFGAGLLFAAVHADVWPSPIALFPLGLALGFLAYRTQSLIGPITLHSLFNAITCLTMLISPSETPVK